MKCLNRLTAQDLDRVGTFGVILFLPKFPDINTLEYPYLYTLLNARFATHVGINNQLDFIHVQMMPTWLTERASSRVFEYSI